MAKLAGMFFSVLNPLKIAGVLYHPSVCYPVPGSLENTIADLAGKGLVRVYQEEMRFVTGIAYPVKPKAPQATVQRPSVPSTPRKRQREF
jgi:hypothetical protein